VTHPQQPEDTPQETPAATPESSAIRVELTVSRAASAARAGNLESALSILNEFEGSEAAVLPDILDLRARVHAQLGQWDEAAEAWRAVNAARPGDPAALAGLNRIRHVQGSGTATKLKRAGYRMRPALAAVVCTGVLTTSGALIGFSVSGEPEPEPPSASAAASRKPDTAKIGAAAVQRFRREAAARQQRETSKAEAGRKAALKALADGLRGPGIDVVQHPNSVEVLFEQGLFLRAAGLTGPGAAQLDRLGRRLPDRADLRIDVIGHSARVPGAPEHGGTATSLWRALVAARVLASASGRPLTDFSTASADRGQLPHRSAAANRTVTVVLTPEARPASVADPN
jgi:tetratricopeptide (TPR) repeat protein